MSHKELFATLQQAKKDLDYLGPTVIELKAERNRLAAENKRLREALEYLLTCKHGEFCDHYNDAVKQARAALKEKP